MTKRMLIDAAHPEETRVVVLDGNRLEDFDYESASRRTLKGNIYLGKITRVEPSLQAAFVDYGGNRHGFLPFSDIHPDYYRIPIADREALIAQEPDAPEELNGDAGNGHGYNGAAAAENGEDAEADEEGEKEVIETVGGEELVEPPRNLQRLRRSYKIQEVIKRRQVVLVQVTKEERGNKGAALTTYISLAGRYCVLMPNAIRGGGISRKITNVKDRRRLKDIIDSLDLPSGMAVILRTAGMERSKAEIRRDYDFLTRVWDEIREKTFHSRAPSLIYEEANLIKRTIRDVYSRDIEEVLVEGEDAYRTAKSFMRALMPSHAKRVQLYKDRQVHLFPRFQVESQLDALHAPTVRLKSGGYIVINPTEALVAIDVNSGRATRERHIEETALRTNLEAASEIARQLRLRDLAGLIVIDFIDMEDRRNNAAVERRLKEAMRFDRARVQLGRISQLGLLELSRQRLRPSLVETSMQVCPHCDGRGLVRTVESTALHVFRAIEEEAARRRSAEIAVHVTTPVALYILNHKRNALYEIEKIQGLRVILEQDDTLVSPAFRIDHLKPMPKEEEARAPAPLEVTTADEEDEEDAIAAQPAVAGEEPEEERQAEAENGEGDDRPRRRRRGRRGGRRRGRRHEDETAVETVEAEVVAADAAEVDTVEVDTGAEPLPREPSLTAEPDAGPSGPEDGAAQPEPHAEAGEEAVSASETSTTEPEPAAEPKARPRRRRPRRTRETSAAAAEPVPQEEPQQPEPDSQAALPGDEAPPAGETADMAAAESSPEAAPEPVAAELPPPELLEPEIAATDIAADAMAAEVAVADATREPTEPEAAMAEPEHGGIPDAARYSEGNGAEVEEPAESAPAAPEQQSVPAEPRPRRRGWWQRPVE